ncbi:MAG: NYN domain-containing protein [Acidobacteriia bacterium]|nr:NYN domain-containing protein [Terriglobia bacterium]MYC67376.1 NYN domain-containing protein [Terriglobia bacterium]
MPERRRFAVFIDYDNIAIGIKASRNRSFRYELVLNWVRSHGEVLTQVAYGNWSSHVGARQIQSKLAARGVRMEHLETAPSGGKNGADIALALEALELVFTQEHIDSFCIVSGDSDFLPLIHKLKRYNKRVYICACQDTISANLRRNCNEFISYEELLLAPEGPKSPARRKHRPAPLEEALPYVKDAIRDMDRRGETPFMNELSNHIAYREPDLDPRSFGCDSFKDLIYQMLESGHLWRKQIDPHMFCVAISDRHDAPHARRLEGSRRYDRPRETHAQQEFEAPTGLGRSGASEGRSGASAPGARPAGSGRANRPDAAETAVRQPRGDALEAVVSVLKGAIERIEDDGHLADVGLLYETALRIDPKFRSYGVRRMAFQPLLERMARDGLFALSQVDGRIVVATSRRDRVAPAAARLPAQPDAAGKAQAQAKAATAKAEAPARALGPSVDLEFKVGGPVADALALIVPVLRANKELAGPGLSRDELKDAVLEVQPGFKCANYGLKTYRDLFARARNEGLLETRDEENRGTRYFSTARLARVPLAKG